MSVLETHIDPHAPEFRDNATHMQRLVAELNTTVADIVAGGDANARDKHVSRGKLLPRERISILLDAGAPFLELSQLAAHAVYDDAIPGAGIITGIGRVMGQECMVVANDATVKGGTTIP